MTTETTPKDLTPDQILIDGSRDERVYLCSLSFRHFFAYYFTPFFQYKTPQFHEQMFADIEALMDGRLEQVAWVMFRESAKTTIVKAAIVWAICYRRKRFINYDCYDKHNAEAALFDIAVWLQTNQRILADFGHLYEEPERQRGKKEMKRVSEFVTVNGVKVKAYSTQQSTRGRVYDRYRPDFYVIDDFETADTKRSGPVTEKIIEHMNELRAGLGPEGSVIYPCNLITDSGSVARVIERLENTPRCAVRNVPVLIGGKPAWPGKYALTDEEATARSAAEGVPIVSIEARRRSLGEAVFQAEMMNNPAAAEEALFDRRTIDKLLEKVEIPRRVIANLRIYEEFDPKHRYTIGADTSAGVGRDSCASVIIDVDKKPAVVSACYDSNRIDPMSFAHELKREAEIYGEPLVAPEINETGWATVTTLRQIYPMGKIYRRQRKDTATGKVSDELGWHTGANKHQIIYALKQAVEDGALEVRDERLLREMRGYGIIHLRETTATTTRHFDLLIACAIAWEVRTCAQMAKADRKPFVPKPWEPLSAYEGK